VVELVDRSPDEEHRSRADRLVRPSRGAARSYSIAAAPEDVGVVISVERLDDGEVSPYLVDELRVGDELELRPHRSLLRLGRLGAPLLLLAGGSGVVPLRSILRYHPATESVVPTRLLYWVRAPDHVIYRGELVAIAFGDSVDNRFTLTREQAEG
jgi:ferredoxin-NADP reductase